MWLIKATVFKNLMCEFGENQSLYVPNDTVFTEELPR